MPKSLHTHLKGCTIPKSLRMPPRLQNISSGSARVQPGQLTPRTPHSRAGRAEEAFSEFELEQFGDDDYREYALQQQAEPLLASSASANFPPSGYQARRDDGQTTRNPRKIIRWLIANLGLVFGSALAFALILLIVLSYRRPDALLSAVGAIQSLTPTSPETLKQDKTLSIPENIISYENYTHFPLDPIEYLTECHNLMGEIMGPMEFWSGQKDVVHHDEADPGKYPVAEGWPIRVCNKTITYMLDGHVGLLADLALMAQAAGLAREAGRTFLVDDTYWNRGKWTDHFQDVRMGQPGPEPGCRAPPPEELVACPRNARHWVINSRTAKYHFGHAFSEEFEDPYGRQLNRLRGIFNRARVSLTQTIRPNAAIAALIHSARIELASFLGLDSNGTLADQYLSIHARLGDGMGLSWKYHDKNVPIEEYAAAGNAAWTRLFRSAGNSALQSVYLASDDPNVFEDLLSRLEPGSRMFSLAKSANPELRNIASPAPYFQDKFSALPESYRVQLTKGMIVDFALFSGLWAWDDDLKPGAVICGLGSNVCKMAAVALDWDRAFGYGFGDDSAGDVNQEYARWIEVDEKGNISPPWMAFEMF
ncbi:hypothetical protein B0F90DRAFT_1829427 [Multifurca ochricompacta]|uniref:Uncharacterized protein n=1 Tax=Multifurca ochricompacta TaxID=376703 RepID=A0AAD4MD11_9AGAM|nr:hypothetical protein B0F90DRAFT_1829427 [Multifurca ochricompacta]